MWPLCLLPSLSSMFSRFISLQPVSVPFVAEDCTMFASEPLHVLFPPPGMYHVLFTHPSIDGDMGCFHLLAIVSRAARNCM